MAGPYCFLRVSYCNFILEIDKDENLKQWKTNASRFYDKENRNTGGKKKKGKIL
jgi:hypothetical protein